MPGIAGEETIHQPQTGDDLGSESRDRNIRGNPVHEDMLEAAEMFRIDFSVNCILNNTLQLSAVYAGTLKMS